MSFGYCDYTPLVEKKSRIFTSDYFEGFIEPDLQFQIGYKFFTGYKDIRHHDDGYGTSIEETYIVEQDFQVARHWLEKSANAGNGLAHLLLGLMSWQGLDKDKNLLKALQHFNSALETKAPESNLLCGLVLEELGKTNYAKNMYLSTSQDGNPLGDILLQNLIIKTDPTKKNDLLENNFSESAKKVNYFDYLVDDPIRDTVMEYVNKSEIVVNAYYTALDTIKPLANFGDKSAQDYVGWLYEHGIGLPQRINEAYTNYLHAAEQGSSFAQYHIFKLWQSNKAQFIEKGEALHWLETSAKNGYVHAKFEYATQLSDEEGSQLLIDAAQSSLTKAMALLYYYPKVDPATKFKCLKTGAQLGSTLCSSILYEIYAGISSLDSIKEDHFLARKFLGACDILAVKDFDKRSAFILYRRFMENETVKLEDVLNMLDIASRENIVEASWNLACVYAELGNNSKFIEICKEISSIKNPKNYDIQYVHFANRCLTRSYIYGERTKKDYQLAFKYASQSSDAESLYILSLLCKYGKGCERNIDREAIALKDVICDRLDEKLKGKAFKRLKEIFTQHQSVAVLKAYLDSLDELMYDANDESECMKIYNEIEKITQKLSQMEADKS